MSFLAGFKKWIRFWKEEKVLSRIDAQKTTYTEETVNGFIGFEDVLIDGKSVKTSLEAKAEYINAASEKERKARERAVAKAARAGKPLSSNVVMALRRLEEKKRLEAYKHIKAMLGRGRQ